MVRPSSRHKVSVIGLGVMGSRHARVLAGLPDRFEIVAAYDLRPEQPTPPGVRRVHSEAEAIAMAEVIVVATPIGAHGPTVSRALGAGRHLLVEKPLCATAEEAEALAADSARGPGRLFVGHSERFNPVVRALARLVRGQRVLSLHMHRSGPSRPCDVGALVNLGVHDLDLAAYLTAGEPIVRGAVGDDDAAHVLLATRGEGIGHVYVDRTLPIRRRALTLATARWIYEGDLLEHRLVRTGRDTGVRTDVPLPLDEPLAAQALALADALDGVSVREIATAADGARAVHLAERAARCCTSAEKLSIRARP